MTVFYRECVEKIRAFADAYKAGRYVPPIEFRVMNGRTLVVERHQRRRGALIAVSEGAENPWLMGNSTMNGPQATDHELTRGYAMCTAREEQLKESQRRIKTVKEAIETDMLARLNRRKQDGFRTADATVSRSKATFVSCAAEGWPRFYRWLLDEAVRLAQAKADPTQIFAYLHKRMTKETVGAYTRGP